MADVEPTFTPDERRRNSHGATYLFVSEGHALFAPIVGAQVRRSLSSPRLPPTPPADRGGP
eukprot:5199302-Prymnesium_polylepis.1